MTTEASRNEHPSTATGPFIEVTVYAGVLRATAELVELLHEFFTSTDSSVRALLGQFITHRQPDLAEPAIAAAITLHELTEAADLLHALAGHRIEDIDGDHRPLHRQQSDTRPRHQHGTRASNPVPIPEPQPAQQSSGRTASPKGRTS